jgi:hypothetical protein
MSGDRCPECHASWDVGPEHWHKPNCPRSTLQDAILEWLLDAPVSRKHLAQELERLLRRAVYLALTSTRREGPPHPDEPFIMGCLLQALKDENDGTD